MRNILFVTAMLLAACAEEVGDEIAPPEDEDSVYVPDPEEEGQLPPGTQEVSRMRDDMPDLEVCNLLPQDDSACAHACDPVALLAFIPAGTCATFTCELIDGSNWRTGGCNN